MKVIIIDDEENSINVLKKLLEFYAPDFETIAIAKNVNDAYDVINLHQPDAIFLDINLSNETGFDLLKKFQTIFFDIIFVTSHDEFAIRAIKFNALDYLLKPVEIPLLEGALQRLRERKKLNQHQPIDVINVLNVYNDNAIQAGITIPNGNKVKFLKLSEIIYIEASSNYSHIHLNSNEIFIHAKLLGYYEDLFLNISSFFRANKSQIINVNYIQEYSKGEPCIVFLKNSKEIEISRRKKTDLLNLLNKL